MIKDKLLCPKCGSRSLRKSHGRNPIGEMFCDRDRIYFTIWELVKVWGFDAGDFINNNGVSLLPSGIGVVCTHEFLVAYPPFIPKTPFIPKMFKYANQCMDCFEIFPEDKKSDTVSMFEGEPMWQSNQEREEAYEMVHRMFMGIPEYDDYQDLKNTQECALDIGVQ